jgi:hypothetical protein
MENYIQKGLKAVLEGEYDCNEQRVGNYLVTMKWDGYSAMVDISYLKPNGQHDFQICHWDSLDKRIELPVEDNLHGNHRQKVIMAIKAIKQLGYELNQIGLYQYEPGTQAYVEDVTQRFQRHIA